MTDPQGAVQRLKAIEAAIQKAELEVGVRQKQLDELKPKRKEYEEQSISKYGVPINKLEAHCQQLEAEAEELVGALETKLEEAQNDDNSS